MTRVARVVGGFILILAGIVMLVLPGPGVLTILGGLALIGQEFEWARRIVDRVKAWVATALGRSSEPLRPDAEEQAPSDPPGHLPQRSLHSLGEETADQDGG